MRGNIRIGDGSLMKLAMKLADCEFGSSNDRAYELDIMVTEMFYGEQYQTSEFPAYPSSQDD